MNNYSIFGLLLLVFIDSFGNGISFSLFPNMIFNNIITIPNIISINKEAMYGLLVGISSFCMFIFSPIIGNMSDIYGRKIVLVSSSLGLTVGFIICIIGCIYKSFLMLLFGRLITGITSGSLAVAQATATDFMKRIKNPILSYIISANLLGFIASAPIIKIFNLINTSMPIGSEIFIFSALVSTTCMLLLIIGFKENKIDYTNNNEKKLILLDYCKNIGSVFSDLKVKKNIISFIYIMFSYCIFFTNIPIYINFKYIYANKYLGSILSLIVVIISLSSIFANKYFIKMYIPNKIFKLSHIIQSLALSSILLISKNLLTDLFLFMIISTCFGISYVLSITKTAQESPLQSKGKTMGIIASITSASWTIAALICSILSSYKLEYIVMICLILNLIPIIKIIYGEKYGKIIFQNK